MDNFPVPRLWTEDFSHICGEGPLSSPYSNSVGPLGHSPRAWDSPLEALEGPLRGLGGPVAGRGQSIAGRWKREKRLPRTGGGP